ncbi:MAG: DNA methyltransferase [Chloroflexota bacterium]
MFLEHADTIYALMRALLIEGRYCCVLAGTGQSTSPSKSPTEAGVAFPVAWSVAFACRDHLRLRDEKVMISEDGSVSIYCLVMQAADDERPAYRFSAQTIRVATCAAQPFPGWTIQKSPPRTKSEQEHPAKFPEALIGLFLTAFTRIGESVLDPMVGTGSTVIAAMRGCRNGYGIELIGKFAAIAKERIEKLRGSMLGDPSTPGESGTIIDGDATQLSVMTELDGRTFDYAITSPPYWSMLGNAGSENQAARRKKNLTLVYSDNESDLGNVQDYDQFLALLDGVYSQVADKLRCDGCLTVIVKNVKRHHVLYPLAWDLTARLCSPDGKYDYLGTTLWCQDDISLKPFALGSCYVTNTLHTYCMHFKKRAK